MQHLSRKTGSAPEPARAGTVPDMDRSLHCAHPGCGRPVAAILSYDYANRVAWLDQPTTDDVPGWALCGAHAGRQRVPVGWELQDRRPPSLSVVPPIVPPPIAV